MKLGVSVPSFSSLGALVALSFGAVTAPSTGAAQSVDPLCPGGSVPNVVVQDACQKAVDIFAFMAPQLGIGLVGGNATLGTGGTLGGPGRFSIGLRGNGISGRMPQVADVSPVVTGAQRSDYAVENQVVGLPAVEGALGLFGGIPLGVTRAFALDALVSATYVPEVSSDNVAISLPDGSFKFGFGGRLGLIEESLVTPSVAVTYLRRDLPTTTISATSGNDEIAVNDISVKTSAWRGVVGKSFGFVGLAVGAGQDEYDSRANASVQVTEGALSVPGGPYTLSQKVTRTNMFADFSLNFPFVKFGVEIGRVSGGTIETYNTFAGKRADDPLTYASVGLRIGN
jgi:hypothetical protein